MSDNMSYADAIRQLRAAEARTDAAREAYVAAMAAEAAARAPIKDMPAVLPGSASQDGAAEQLQKGNWGASDDENVLLLELKTLIARAEERMDHASIYRAQLASQLGKLQSASNTRN
jgi:chemotaxis regulatin CheY-phosphate phosphatase CheZ